MNAKIIFSAIKGICIAITNIDRVCVIIAVCLSSNLHPTSLIILIPQS
ncbi:MAG: hypothetical protein IPQ05_07380 [Leptospiraceae bacterium]|nr:hypothetical protein [Leptospiraceae bacterium]